MRAFVGRTRGWALLAVPLVFALAACEPVTHPSFTVRESPESAVTFRLLSGDASQAVVTATAAGQTVPGPGVWRVDRSDGSVVELPAGEPTKISSDGERVLVGPSLWSSGSVLTPPSTVMSEQLTFALFVDTDGQVKTWETATGTVTPVETAFPRPPGTTAAIAKGVSDDGRTAQYELQGPNRIERFVDLDAGAAVDRPNGDDSFGSDGPLRAGGWGRRLPPHPPGSAKPSSNLSLASSVILRGRSWSRCPQERSRGTTRTQTARSGWA